MDPWILAAIEDETGSRQIANRERVRRVLPPDRPRTDPVVLRPATGRRRPRPRTGAVVAGRRSTSTRPHRRVPTMSRARAPGAGRPSLPPCQSPTLRMSIIRPGCRVGVSCRRRLSSVMSGDTSARRSVSRVLSRPAPKRRRGDGHPSKAGGCPTAHAADPRAGQRTSPPTGRPARVAPSYLALLRVEFAAFHSVDRPEGRSAASSLWHWSSSHDGRALPATLR